MTLKAKKGMAVRLKRTLPLQIAHRGEIVTGTDLVPAEEVMS